MEEITTIGIDLAKSVFQVHGVREDGSVGLRQKLRRGQVLGFFAACPSCLVGLKPALVRTTGPANLSPWATTCGSCRRPTSNRM